MARNSENHTETAGSDAGQCAECQHSVDVRGMAQIVCLAFLMVRQPMEIVACKEFEAKRKNREQPERSARYWPDFGLTLGLISPRQK